MGFLVLRGVMLVTLQMQSSSQIQKKQYTFKSRWIQELSCSSSHQSFHSKLCVHLDWRDGGSRTGGTGVGAMACIFLRASSVRWIWQRTLSSQTHRRRLGLGRSNAGISNFGSVNGTRAKHLDPETDPQFAWLQSLAVAKAYAIDGLWMLNASEFYSWCFLWISMVHSFFWLISWCGGLRG